MERKADSKRKITRIIIGVVVILALMLTMHVLVNYFNLFQFLKGLHGG